MINRKSLIRYYYYICMANIKVSTFHNDWWIATVVEMWIIYLSIIAVILI